MIQSRCRLADGREWDEFQNVRRSSREMTFSNDEEEEDELDEFQDDSEKEEEEKDDTAIANAKTKESASSSKDWFADRDFKAYSFTNQCWIVAKCEGVVTAM